MGTEHKILIVDDEDTIREMLLEMLSFMGVNAEGVDNGQSAIDLLQANPEKFSLIFLDLNMPGLDGKETYQALREFLPEIPVYIASGYGEGKQTDELLEMGAAGILPKPFKFEDVKNIVNN